MALIWPAFPAAAQLDPDCVVSALNRSARVRFDGSWVLRDIPTDRGPVRVRATCTSEGETRTGASDFFVLEPDSTLEIPQIQLGANAAIPATLTLSLPVPELTAAGQTAQLTVDANFTDGSVQNLTTAASGTSYTVSNPSILTLSGDGLVTAVSSGTAIVSASNEGALGLLRVSVVLSGDSDGDGIPDDVEIAQGLDPNDPIDGLEDTDGDGLTNSEELAEFGTDFRVADTDGDGLDDGEEVRPGDDGFITNALAQDTDGDQLRDGLEIETGSDPTDPTSFNLADALASFAVEPSTIVFTRPVGDSGGEVSRQLTVSGELIDGNPIDLTSTAFGTNYLSSDLFVCSFGVPDGRLFAGQDGTCTVSIDNSGFDAQVAVTVNRFPIPVASLAMPGYANNVWVTGDFAYVAAGDAGLVVVDLANRAAPEIVATLDTPGQANDVEVRGDLAYIADHDQGLLVVDVSIPSSPLLLGGVATPGPVLDVELDADSAEAGVVYLALNDQGLVVVDVTAPAAPTIVGSLPVTLGGATLVRDIAAQAGAPLLAVAARSGSTSAAVMVDVSDPSAPVQLGSGLLPESGAQIEAVAFTGNAVLAGDRARIGLSVFDVADPSAPLLLATMNRNDSGLLNDIEVSGGLAVGADIIFVNAAPVIDVSDPADPFVAGFADFSGTNDDNGTGIAVDETYLYLTASSNGARFRGSGSSRLYIARVAADDDVAGVPPTVEILSPADGESFFSGETVRVVVDALDDVGVASVSVFLDGQPVASDTTDPFALDVVMPSGVSSVTLSATATDFGANTAATAPITLSLDPNQPPSVEITSPAVGVTPLENTSVTLAAEVSDDRALAEVIFRVDDEVVFTNTEPPFATAYFIPLDTTSFTFEVSATDDLGVNTTVTRVVTVAVDPPPEVILTSPAEGENLTAEFPALISAEVSDAGGLTLVVIRVDGTEVFSDTPPFAPPFAATVDVPLGTVSLAIEVEAADNLGRTTLLSRAVPVVVGPPPEVVLVTPADGSTVIEGQPLTIFAQASDDVGVTGVDLAVDGTVVASLTSPPFQAEVTAPFGASEFVVTATATDTADQTSVAVSTVNVVPDAPPTITLLEPADGEQVAAGSVLRVSAQASDDLGVAAVHFFAGGALAFADTAAPFEADLEVPASSGTLEIFAVAEDTAGQETQTPAVTVEVIAGSDTTVIGRVLDEAGDPAFSAAVTCAGVETTTLADGTFEAPGVSAEDLVSCEAVLSTGDGRVLDSRSAAVEPVIGGVTDVGDIRLAEVALFAGVGRGSENNPGSLLTVDQATGAGVLVGQTLADGGGLTGLAFDRDDRLFGSTIFGFGSVSTLVRIDALSGALLETVGEIREAGVGLAIGDLAFEPGTGVLFALGTQDFDGELYRVDTATAEATFVGMTPSRGGIAFGPDGTFYHIGFYDGGGEETALHIIDPADGSVLLTLPVTEFYDGLGARPGDGLLFGTIGGSEEIVAIDGTTGEETFLGFTGAGAASDLDFRASLPQDPGTTVVGTVVDTAGLPAAGAVIDCLGLRAQSQGDGSFSIEGVPTFDGNFRCIAVFRDVAQQAFRGRSELIVPVPDGVTDVGEIVLRSSGASRYPGAKISAGSGLEDVAVGDFDGDGFDDVALASADSNGVSVLFGNGDATFRTELSRGAGSGPFALVAADFDGDDVDDLAVANEFSDDVSILIADGAGSFLPQQLLTAGDRPQDILAADLDLDGRIDLAVANRGSDDLSVFFGLGGGSFTGQVRFAVTVAPDSVASADFDGDGRPDLATGGFSPAEGAGVVVLRGLGGRSFGDESFVNVCCDAEGLLAADFNGDGAFDLLAISAGDPVVSFFAGLGDGSFAAAQDLTAGSGGSAFAVAGAVAVDLDGNGLPDVARTSDQGLSVLLSRPDGFDAERRFLPGSIGRAVATGDFNGDLIPDLVTANVDDTISLALGLGDGTVESPAVLFGGRKPLDLAFDDVDGDGFDDLVAADFGLFMQRSRGDGTFDPLETISLDVEASGVVLGDFDGDGVLDLAATVDFLDHVAVMLGVGDGTFLAPSTFTVASGPVAIETGDFDGDGLLDIVTASPSGDQGSVLHGNGDGTFRPEVRLNYAGGGASGPSKIAVADFNRDGMDDLVTANLFSSNLTTVRSLGGDLFQLLSFPIPQFPQSVASADVTGDGIPDLVTANDFPYSISIAPGTGNGLFGFSNLIEIEGSGPVDVAVVDIDGDGDNDVITANSRSADVSILFKSGSSFVEQLFEAGPVPVGIDLGDANGDGRLDIAVRQGEPFGEAIVSGPPVKADEVEPPPAKMQAEFEPGVTVLIRR